MSQSGKNNIPVSVYTVYIYIHIVAETESVGERASDSLHNEKDIKGA